MTTMLIPGTYKLDIDLSSGWSVEMKFIKSVCPFKGGPDLWEVETNLPFNITHVIVMPGEYYFYDNSMKEMLERWEEPEVKEFFGDEKKFFIEYLKTISPVDSWKLIS